MDIKEAILNRRSVRRYIDKKVDIKLIAEILEVARYAPSSGNLQNWHVVIVTNDNKRRELAIASLKQMWMVSAPVHIVICDKKENIKRYYGERGELYSIQNCAAFAQNILLIATSLELANCWVGAFDKEAVRRIIKVPENEVPEVIITLGYSKEKLKLTQRDDIDRITCFEECGIKEKAFGLFPLEKHKEKLKKLKKNLRLP